MQVNPDFPQKSGPGSGALYRRALWTPSRIPMEEDLLLSVEKSILKKARQKQNEDSWVARATLHNREVVIKKFPKSWKDLFRLSRARRAWAGALTLAGLEIPTVEALGFLETRNGSFFVYAYEDAITVRDWVKPALHKKPMEERRQVADELLEMLLKLYRRGIYHGDTKAGNLLVVDHDKPDSRRYAWIDLESIRPFFKPKRRQILNNLVQLNGSVGTRICREDRLYFQTQIAKVYEWAGDGDVAEYVARKTKERLLKEVKREEGP